MTDLLAARLQMAVSLGFHIIFAVVGIGMPALMVWSEWRWLRTREEVYLRLARQWAKGTAIFFAVGAVSGTVLSFELGLLWPTFMEYAGPLIGMPFSLEGFAFFTEAIFLGVYLYGWERVSERAHLAAGVLVAISGLASAVFVMSVNGWMNSPTGLELGPGGEVTGVDPVAAMLNPAWVPETLHMVIAAYLATGFAVAGVHAWRTLREGPSRFHRKAMGFGLVMGGVMAVLQPISGDVAARFVAEQQPVKLAAMEGQFETEAGAPLRIGGLPDAQAGTTEGALEIPRMLSLLAFHDPDAVVRGLEEFPRELWPPLAPVRIAWQLMVAIGLFLAGLSVVAAWRWWRGADPLGERWLLVSLVAAAPLGFVGIEAGWVVTEVGRQPWIIQGIMRTEEAVTSMPAVETTFLGFTLLYLLLGAVVAVLVRRMVIEEPGDA